MAGKPSPYGPNAYYDYCGMAGIEREVARLAADEAVREARESWLPILEQWFPTIEINDEGDLMFVCIMRSDIRRLRSKLGVGPSPQQIETRRAMTRERVRRHRAKARQRSPS
jgi:hypothetical protein